MDKIKIIVVEDNIVYCEFVCNLLARELMLGDAGVMSLTGVNIQICRR